MYNNYTHAEKDNLTPSIFFYFSNISQSKIE